MALAAVLCGALHAPQAAAQVVDAQQNLSCIGERVSNLNCQAGEFVVGASLVSAAGSPVQCVAGETIDVNVLVSLTGSNTDRYDIGFFIGQQGNSPATTTSGNVCSVATFPNSPLPWYAEETAAQADACGDFKGGGAATPTVQNLRIVCQGDPVTGEVQVPYTLTYKQNSAGVCTGPANVSGLKCNTGTSTIGSLLVHGYVDITKQTLPDASAGSFAFAATGSVPSGVSNSPTTPTPSAFNLVDGQTQRVTMPINGSARLLTIDENVPAHWRSSISCSSGAVDTSGQADGTLVATLQNASPSAACTITNTKRSRITLVKNVAGRADPADQFVVAASGGGVLTDEGDVVVSSPRSVQTSGATTSASTTFYSTPGSQLGFADAMAAGSPSALSEYSTTYQCTNAYTGAGATTVLPSGAGTSFALAPAPGDDITCVFTNASKPRITLQKALGGAGRGSDTDQFMLTIAGGGAPASVTTSGGGSAVTSAPAALTADAGVTYTLSEAAAGTTNLALYGSAISCTNGNAGSATVLPTGAGTSFTLTPGNSDRISCVITNTPRTRRLTVEKDLLTAGDPGQFVMNANGTLGVAGGDGAMASTVVNVGASVTFAEAAAPGSDLGNYTSTYQCSRVDNGNPVAQGTGVSGSFAMPDADVTCVLANLRKTRTVAVRKVLVPATDAGVFNLQVNGATVAANVGDGGAGSAIVPVGAEVVVAETSGTATSLGDYAASLVCAGVTVAPGGGQAGTAGSFAMPDADISCTFSNSATRATLTLVKQVVNDNGGTAVVTDFTLTANGSVFASGASQVVIAGTYVLAESGPSGYVGGGWNCSAGTLTGNSLELRGGENAVCTIVNDDAAASLSLVKQVVNDNGGTALATDWTLSVTGPTPLSGAGGVVATAVTAGSYTLAEAGGPTGYEAGAWSCTAGTLTGSTLTLANGENAVCTIVNDDAAASLALVKQVVNDSGGTALATDWTLSATGPTPLSGAGGVVATAVAAGTYTLAEAGGPAGYVAGAWSCTAGTLSGSTLTLANGESAVCTIVNDDAAASLALVKQVVNDNGGTALATDWTLSATGPTPLSGAGGVTATAVAAGTYTLAEAGGPTGYVHGAWNCTAGTLSGRTLTLANGENAVCTIVNDDAAASLTLVKQVVNDNGGSALATDWTLSATGPTPLSGAGGVIATAVAAGTYTLAEAGGPAGYVAGAWSCTAGTLTGTRLVLANGESAVCTIVNDDVLRAIAAVDDASTTAQNTPVRTSVLTNDTRDGSPVDPGVATLSIAAVPANGVATVNADGTIAYTPSATFSGADRYSYTFCEAANPSNCATAEVTITVLPNVVTAVDDTVATAQSVPVMISVLGNDRTVSAPLDPGSVTIGIIANGTITAEATSVTTTGNGRVSCVAGACTYAPTARFAGRDSFGYRVCDVSTPTPVCDIATVTIDITPTAAVLRLSKQAGRREAKVGDLVRYTVQVDNIGDAPAIDARLVDTLPAGFTYVDGSLVVDDDNDSGTLGGIQPLRIDGIDLAAGARATITYTLRVGAGVGPGVHTNSVAGTDDLGDPISNVATADVLVVGDPLFDDSLIVGSVFDDRNGSGVQDANERGIPGVRIASVEGLVMETDAFGRYHLVGIDAAGNSRGRNFILKVDKATLPPGTTFTTENPRVRRITPGVPVRFDFGVKLPDGSTGGGRQDIDVELGEVLFDAGSAQIKPDYAALFETIAGKVREYGGGRLVITAKAEEEALALARARAVQAAVTGKLAPELASRLSVDVITDIDSTQPLVSLDKAINLGSVLFDTDKSTIRPQYRALIRQVAAELNRDGKGVIGVIGRADLRGTNSYNVWLGLRRAKAVFEAISAELRPEVRRNVRMDITEDTSAETGVGGH